MAKSFAAGKKALGICDRCGWTYKLAKLKYETVNLNRTNLRVCPDCFDPDHPQLQAGRIDYHDPQALRDPRIDTDPGTSTTDRGNTVTGYEFTSDADGWAATVGASLDWTTEGGTGVVTLSGGTTDEALFISGLGLAASTYNTVRISIRSDLESTPTDWIGRLYFKATGDVSVLTQWVDVPRPEFFTTGMGSQWHELVFDVGSNSDWAGTISTLQFSPYGSADSITAYDHIRVESRS